jgi:hypothetical protein
MKRRDWLILLAAWLVVAAGLVSVIIVLRPKPESLQAIPTGVPPTVVPTFTVEYVEVTASRLFSLAEANAKAWQPDVEPAGASASWPQTAVNLVGNPVDWQFRFYSPSQNRLYFVSVTPDGQVNGSPHFRSESRPPATFSRDDWKVDSVQALATWLDSGGGSFLGQNPGVRVVAQLGLDPSSGRLVWNVAGLDDTGEKYWVVVIDASTGQVSRPVVGSTLSHGSFTNG